MPVPWRAAFLVTCSVLACDIGRAPRLPRHCVVTFVSPLTAVVRTSSCANARPSVSYAPIRRAPAINLEPQNVPVSIQLEALKPLIVLGWVSDTEKALVSGAWAASSWEVDRLPVALRQPHIRVTEAQIPHVWNGDNNKVETPGK